MPTSDFTVKTIYVNEGDDWVEELTVPDTYSGDISGYTNWSCQIMDASVLTADVSSAVTSGSVIVSDNALRTIEITVDKANTDDLVAEGSTERLLYSDIQTDISGNTNTVLKLNWRAQRKRRPTT